jgi:hypothetical protein
MAQNHLLLVVVFVYLEHIVVSFGQSVVLRDIVGVVMGAVVLLDH